MRLPPPPTPFEQTEWRLCMNFRDSYIKVFWLFFWHLEKKCFQNDSVHFSLGNTSLGFLHSHHRSKISQPSGPSLKAWSGRCGWIRPVSFAVLLMGIRLSSFWYPGSNSLIQCLVGAGMIKALFEASTQCLCILWLGYCNYSGAAFHFLKCLGSDNYPHVIDITLHNED